MASVTMASVALASVVLACIVMACVVMANEVMAEDDPVVSEHTADRGCRRISARAAVGAACFGTFSIRAQAPSAPAVGALRDALEKRRALGRCAAGSLASAAPRSCG